MLVSTINGAGSAIESIYVLVFLIFAPKKEKAKIFGLFMAVITVFAAVALVSLLALHGNARKIFCGSAASVFSIIMYASPLSVMVSSVNLALTNVLFNYNPSLVSIFLITIKCKSWTIPCIASILDLYPLCLQNSINFHLRILYFFYPSAEDGDQD